MWTHPRRGMSVLTGSFISSLFSFAAMAAPLPSFTPAPAGAGDVLSGEPYQVAACFDNASAKGPGFAPTIQVVVPAGSTLSSASYLGNPQTVRTLGTCAAADGCSVVNPDTGAAVGLAQNETLAIVRYSPGSFSASQPPACANMNFQLGNTTVAPLAVTRDIVLTPIFVRAKDSLDNSGSDAAVAGMPVSMPVTAQLLKLTKTIVAPEAENATGQNFPRTVNIAVQVANGATITAIVVKDVLPGEFQFVPGTLTFTGCAGPVTATSTPTGAGLGGTVARTCSTVTGNGAPGTLSLSYQFLVPNRDSTSVAVATPFAPNKAIVNPLFGATLACTGCLGLL